MGVRWLMIAADRVANIILWDGDTDTWEPPEGVEMLDSDNAPGVDIGWMRVAGVWGPPAPLTDD